MRRFLASSIGVTCAAALALPLAQPAAAHPAHSTAAHPARPAAAHPAHPVRTASARPAAPVAVPGSTQSLALSALSRERAAGAAPGEGLTRREVRPFSLAGVVWDDARRALHGRVEVRARDARTGDWGGWRELETHNDAHGADRGTAEGDASGVRGSTAPLWLGASDAVEARVTGEPGAGALPGGLRLELVDPGEDDGADASTGASGAAWTADGALGGAC